MFYVPTRSADDWQHLLADPETQWRTGFPAKTVAHCWEDARGFPRSVVAVLEDSPCAALHGLDFILGIPERKTPLPPLGGTPSQSDLLVLAKSGDDLIAVAVEGKVAEPFGPVVSEWLSDGAMGKRKRLGFCCEALEVEEAKVQNIHYQLLHRATAALLEADRFNATYALMLVHSFSQTRRWFNEFAEFTGLFGKPLEQDGAVRVGRRLGKNLFLAWVTGEEVYLNR
jgi:Domain of unknown function (DUF6946)